MKTFSIGVRHIVAVAIIAISTSAVASAQYKFVELKVPGAKRTQALGINNNLVTGAYSDSTGTTYGFTYDPGTGTWLYPISDPKGITTYVNSSDKSGQLVGSYVPAAGGSNGMVMQPTGSFSDVTPNGCDNSVTVTGINDGPYSTMGGYCGNSQGAVIAWESYPANLAFSCSGSVYTEANAINNWALMAGSFARPHEQVTHGFVSTDQGGCTQVNYPGAVQTQLAGINDTGTITGNYWQKLGGQFHGFVLTGSTFASVDVPKAKATSLGQVNNNNWFVGGYADSKDHGHAFYAMPMSGASILLESDN